MNSLARMAISGPLLVFMATLAVTVAVRWQGKDKAAAKDQGKNQLVSRLARGDQGSVVPQVALRKLLKAGDVDGVFRFLRELGERDAVAFFKLMDQMPDLKDLDGIDEEIATAAEKLAWDDPEALALVGGDAWYSNDGTACEGYLRSRIGVLSYQEICQVALKLELPIQRLPGSFFKGPYSDTGMDAVLKGAMKLPAHDAAELIASLQDYEMADDLLLEFSEQSTDSGTVPGRLGEVGAPPPMELFQNQYIATSFYEKWLEAKPTLAAFQVALDQAGPGYRDIVWPGWGFHFVLGCTSPAERENLKQMAAQLRDRVRNEVVESALYDNKLPAEQVGGWLGLASSWFTQSEALTRWVKNNPDLDASDRRWVETLPTEKTRRLANELLDEREGKAVPEERE